MMHMRYNDEIDWIIICEEVTLSDHSTDSIKVHKCLHILPAHINAKQVYLIYIYLILSPRGDATEVLLPAEGR